MDYVLLGDRIREERIKRHLTQEKVAEILNVSDSYYGQIERGERHLTLDTLVEIANYFSITMDFLLSGSTIDNDMVLVKDWIRLTNGKTVKEKRMILDFVEVLIKHFS